MAKEAGPVSKELQNNKEFEDFIGRPGGAAVVGRLTYSVLRKYHLFHKFLKKNSYNDIVYTL